tara:strand:+ start:1582 stop:1872 length:291 start_codon:yes stop_codon:yes gene_type:complete
LFQGPVADSGRLAPAFDQRDEQIRLQTGEALDRADAGTPPISVKVQSPPLWYRKLGTASLATQSAFAPPPYWAANKVSDSTRNNGLRLLEAYPEPL